MNNRIFQPSPRSAVVNVEWAITQNSSAIQEFPNYIGPSSADKSAMSDMSDTSQAPATPDDHFGWCGTTPAQGECEYVQALQVLGIHMATRVPQRIKEQAITELGVEPTSDLLVGDFATQTKERTLKPSCNKIWCFQMVFDVKEEQITNDALPFL